jgi:hypothetical protein
MRVRKDTWILIILSILFAIAVGWVSQHDYQNQQESQPTTYSTGRKGLKAAFQLISSENIPMDRLETPLTKMPSNTGMLVISEPLQTPLSADEKQTLWNWIRKGGTLLLLKSADALNPAEQIDVQDIQAIRCTQHSSMLQVGASSLACFRQVQQLFFSGHTVLRVPPIFRKIPMLLKDSSGSYMVRWDEGEGTVYVTSHGVGFTNEYLTKADDAVFLINIASDASRNGKSVLFDEYHQGFGDVDTGQRSLWQALKPPVRILIWYALFIFLLYIINANRRFGPIKEMPSRAERSVSDYIQSMAGLFQRADAAAIPVLAIGKEFLKVAHKRLELTPDAPSARIAGEGAVRGYWSEQTMLNLLERYEVVLSGKKPDEQEMIHLTKELDTYKKRLETEQHG